MQGNFFFSSLHGDYPAGRNTNAGLREKIDQPPAIAIEY
jgi:hypothetical protein